MIFLSIRILRKTLKTYNIEKKSQKRYKQKGQLRTIGKMYVFLW